MRSKTKGRPSTAKRQKTNEDEEEEQPAGQSLYKPGSISRVKLKNFLTYHEVEFYPGPRYVPIGISKRIQTNI